MWFGVALTILSLIICALGNPLSELHNSDVEIVESKYKFVEKALEISPRFEPTTYRLPNNSIPLNYDLVITTDIDKGLFDFSGVVKIHIRIVNESQEIILHYRQTTIDVINLFTADGTTIIAEALLYVQIPVYEFLVITLPRVYNPNDEVVLEIKYRGEHRADGGGFYRASYVNADLVSVWYATTQFEIDDARHAMPSYDEPGIRAPIQASIKHGRTYTAVSNMDVESITDDGDYVITRFFRTPSIQTYLLAFLVSDFDYVNATNTRIPQKIYARPERIARGYGDFAASVVGPILNGLEQHIGVDYPISKMDHAALNFFNFGAMENIGLITYIEDGLLYDPNTAQASQESRQRSITTLVAHEYVHQWFGNIVSPAWWQYVWLNEGFATLLQYYISDLVYPGMNYMNNFVTAAMPRAFSVDVLSLNSWAMNHYTEEPARLWDKFGGIGYQKSGCVLRMFQEVLTPATFAKGLNYYQNAMYMKAAIPDDLHEGLQRAYDEDYPGNNLNINELMHSWEDRPGYPMITVRLLNNNLVLSQRRYPGSAGEIYSVPITIATKSDPSFGRTTPLVWLHDEVDVFAPGQLNFASDDWIVLNLQQVGYYRVDYDTNLWRAIIRQLKENHSFIHPINRAVLQDEIYLALTDSTLNRVTASDCMDILTYFGKEDEPIAWSKANALITSFNNRLFGTSRYGNFLEFLREITTPHLNAIGYERIDFESSVTTSLRNSIKSWNCLALADPCLSNEYTKFLQFYNTNTSASFDYCHALRNVNGATYEALVNGVARDSSYVTRSNYLNNLGCSLNEEDLKKFLAITLDTTNVLTANERQNILVNTMGRSIIALDTTIQFIDANYAALTTLVSSFSNVLVSLAAFVNSDENVNKLEELISRALDSATFINPSQIRSVYVNNFKWQEDNFEAIDNWFTSLTTTTTTTAPTQPTQPTQPSQPTTPSSATSITLSFGISVACLTLSLSIS
ncbi:Aminopeptidase N [Pseudolycoriella hygida]|uniref:Aminopeptidase n=1 Tax=Pseudolycoriella hygida TaxID=35572 RepID=A0A9Q0MII0_9DIPT|nr:Aminopeptidase N [Pseudolycoriella hygida]KAJ6625251.1 Aminopeptidase N [Pseudolycoriella hygida]KAJ6625911.1 Aminopeptidase N [Pseudolycoriella hygida]